MNERNGQNFDTTSLLSLPVGWCWTQVKDVGEVKLGRQRSPEHHQGDHMRPYLRVANVFENRIDISDVLQMNFTPSEYETYRLRQGDILLNEGQSLEWVGRAAMYSDELPGSCFQNTLVRFRSHACVDPRFALYLFLHYLRNQRFRRIAKWTVNIAHLGAGRFAEIEFPLAPLKEQSRIVEKIEELFSDLDAGVAALKRARANLKRYRASVLKAAVEGDLTVDWRAKHPKVEPASKLLERIHKERRRKWEADQLAKFAAAGKEPPKNWQAKYVEPTLPDTTELAGLPSGWCWAKLDQLLVYLRNGYFQSPSKADTGTPILRINAVRPMSVDLSETRFLDKIVGSVVDYFIENDDLLFTRYNGSVDLLGVAGLVRGCTENILHPDKLIRVKLAIGDSMPSFVEVAANVGASRRHMVGRARTTAGQTGISGTDVREMPIPLPPLDEQARIVSEVAEKLSQIEAADVAIDHGLLRAARLRQSILKQAFEGRLVAHDPADEPASSLLARVQQHGKMLAKDAASEPKKLPREVFLRRASVVSYTVRRLASHCSFGRTQLEKTVYLTQCHLGVDLGFHFQRYAAGPFDKDIYGLEYVARKNNWFTTRKRSKYGVTYHPGTKIDDICRYTPGILGPKQADVDRLFGHMAAMNTDDAELFATAYAAWNDLLVDGRSVDDDAIIAEVHGWHPEKARFTPQMIGSRLQWMRQQGYIPTGQGERTQVVEKRANSATKRRKRRP